MAREDFAELSGRLAEAYHESETLNFVMEYFNFYEGYCDADENSYKDSEITKALASASEKLYEEELCEAERLLFNARESIIDKMEVISAYTDRFENYEYVLNRIENKFNAAEPEDVSDDDMARLLLNAVFASEDNMTININITSMLSQLPVRMTKAKFYDLISESLKSYTKTDRDSCKRYLYLLRSQAGLYEPKGMKDFKEFAEADRLFLETDLDKLDKDGYDRLYNTIQEVSEKLNVLSDEYIELQSVINHLAVVVKTHGYAKERCINEFITMLKHINKGIIDGGREHVPEEWLDVFERYEGKVEQLLYSVEKTEAQYEKALKKEEETELSEVLRVCGKLFSDSIFGKTDKPLPEDLLMADTVFVNGEADKLISEFDKCFSTGSKLLNRARMAAVLKELPIFFNSRTDVMEYVRNVLNNCRDMAEKSASVKLALALMNDEYQSEEGHDNL